MTRPRRSIEERFWEKVDKRGPTECWEWTGAHDNFGYGMVHSGGKEGRALRSHRVSWEIHNGLIPEGMCVLHHCDNPHCVNPRHLFLGTKKDNVYDMIKKGRDRLDMGPHGEQVGSAKLIRHDVRLIRKVLKRGWTQRKIAKAFNVSHATINDINTGKHWHWLLEDK